MILVQAHRCCSLAHARARSEGGGGKSESERAREQRGERREERESARAHGQGERESESKRLGPRRRVEWVTHTRHMAHAHWHSPRARPPSPMPSRAPRARARGHAPRRPTRKGGRSISVAMLPALKLLRAAGAGTRPGSRSPESPSSSPHTQPPIQGTAEIFNAEPGKSGLVISTSPKKNRSPSTLVQMRCFLE